MPNKFIITGANGFIGAWLCKLLTGKNIYVTAVVRNERSNINAIANMKNIEIVYCDLCDVDSLDIKLKGKYDVWIHLAWQGAGGPLRNDYAVQVENIKQTLDSHRVAKKIGCKKFIALGTISEKLFSYKPNLLVSSANRNYGICKAATFQLLQSQVLLGGIPIVWLRCANVFGPHSVNGNLVQYTLKSFLDGLQAEFSKGEQLYDFIYVKDLVKAIYAIAKGKNTLDEYYIGSGTPKKLKSYIKEIEKVAGFNKKVIFGARKDEGLVYLKKWFDIESIRNEFNWSPEFLFHKAVLETMIWLKGEKDGIQN